MFLKTFGIFNSDLFRCLPKLNQTDFAIHFRCVSSMLDSCSTIYYKQKGYPVRPYKCGPYGYPFFIMRTYIRFSEVYFHGSIGVSTFLSRSIRSITASAAVFPSKSTLFTSVMIGISTSYFSASSLAALAE